METTVKFFANIVGGEKMETTATITKTANQKRRLKIYWTCPLSNFSHESLIPYQENILEAFRSHLQTKFYW